MRTRDLKREVRKIFDTYRDRLVGCQDSDQRWNDIFQRTLGITFEEAQKVLAIEKGKENGTVRQYGSRTPRKEVSLNSGTLKQQSPQSYFSGHAEKDDQTGQGLGWVKVPRSLLDSAIYSDAQYLKLWITLLLMANHKERELLVNGSRMLIKPGEFITSRPKLAARSKIEPRKIERILDYLESDQKIAQTNLHSCRLISILSWEQPQNGAQRNAPEMHRDRTASAQRAHRECTQTRM